MSKNQASSIRWWDIPSIFLLIMILTIVCIRLVITHWTNHLSIIATITYLGALAGLVLGYSNFNKVRAFLFSIYYGVFVVIWQLGSTLSQNIPWYDRLIIISERISNTLTILYQRKPVADNLFFLLLMSILFWIISTYAGFSLVRYADPWKIIVPTGIGIVTIHSYDSFITQRIWYLIIFLFFSLILIIRLIFLQMRQKWQTEGSHIPVNINSIFSRLAILTAIILLVLVSVAPVEAKSFEAATHAWEQMKQPFKQIRENIGNAFASLQSSVGIIPEFYNSSLSLGRGVHLSDNQIFTVITPDNPPAGTRYYWRIRIYDVYEKGQWKSLTTENILFSPEKNPIKFPDEPKRKPGEYSFIFTTVRPIASLFLAPEPRWVSVPAQAESIINSDKTVDIFTIKAIPNLSAGASYEVRSSLSGATIHAMDNAGENYPDWITNRYLQIPDTITQRTKDLARDITRDAKTPYDKASAITDYLRKSIKYTETIPQLPANQELVDWFLFDLKEGFCNYYATSEVILLRSLGIPARLAVGYSQGEYQGLTHSYIVKQSDAHAWPEVYFPELGWVEFEPTSTQPILVRPSGETPRTIPTPLGNLVTNKNETDKAEKNPSEETPATQVSHSAYRAFFQALLTGSIIIAIIIIILLILNQQRKRLRSLPPFPILLESAFRKIGIEPPDFIKRWAFQASLPAISRAYQALNHALNLLGKQPDPNKTPYERGLILTGIIPQLTNHIQTLVSEYEVATYGMGTPDLASAKNASQNIQYLARRERFRRVLGGDYSSHHDENKAD